MSDDTPTEGEPETAAPPEPTVDTPPAQTSVPEAAPTADVPAVAPEPITQPEPVAAMTDTTPFESKRRGVFVPAWVGALVVLLVVAAVGFGVGRWTSDDSDSGSTAIANNGGIVPQLPNGNGNNGNGPFGGNNGGSGQNRPPTPSIGNAFLGVATQNATDGVEIVSVGDNTPADGAGLKGGDVITAVDNTKVTTPAALLAAIQSHDPGDQVTIHYTRNGNAATAKVTLGTRTQRTPN